MEFQDSFKQLLQKATGGTWKRLLFSPARAWRLLLMVFVISTVLSALFSAYLFFGIREGDVFRVQTESVANVETINRQLLDKTLLLIETRRATFEELKQERPAFVDPSR